MKFIIFAILFAFIATIACQENVQSRTERLEPGPTDANGRISTTTEKIPNGVTGRSSRDEAKAYMEGLKKKNGDKSASG